MLFAKLRRKQRQTDGMPNTQTITLSTILPSYSTHPIEYRHSYKFLVDGIDPLSSERKRIKGRTVDWLLHDMRDAAIEADSRDEISYGKQQIINHIHCITTIIAQNEGEIELAKQQEFLLRDELNYYQKLEAELKK